MGEATGTAQQSRRAKGEVLRLAIDPEILSLDPETVVVKPTRDGGYVCLGFGPPASFLRKIDSDPNFATVDDAAGMAIAKFRKPFARGEDPFLRRLGSAMALAKDYDSKQPRDDDGRWTSGGVGGAAAITAAVSDVLSLPELAPALRTLAGRLLSIAPAAAAATAAAEGAVLALGILVIPTNRSLISDGVVPDAPDLGYNFDQGTGTLKLTRANEDGSKEILFSGRSGADGLFRDSDGNVVGRNLDGVVVVDPDAVAGYESRRKDKDRSAVGADAQAIPIAKTDEPKLCPDPGPDTPGWLKRSERSLAYQEQISGLPRGIAVDLNGVSYDGCRITDGTMLDAKAQGYAWALDETYTVRSFYTGFARLMDQAQRQVTAANGRPIEWYFAEKPAADYMAGVLAKPFPQIKVIWQPPLPRSMP